MKVVCGDILHAYLSSHHPRRTEIQTVIISKSCFSKDEILQTTNAMHTLSDMQKSSQVELSVARGVLALDEPTSGQGLMQWSAAA